MAEGDVAIIVDLLSDFMCGLVVKTLILLLYCPVPCDRMFSTSSMVIKSSHAN